MSTARDFSVMPVLVVGSDPKPLERAVRSRAGLKIGALIDVEFGATWRSIGDVVKERVDGQWFACRVIGHEGALVRVELLPDVRLNAKNNRKH